MSREIKPRCGGGVTAEKRRSQLGIFALPWGGGGQVSYGPEGQGVRIRLSL